MNTVIVSTRPVDDETTANLTRALYRDEAWTARHDAVAALAHVESAIARAPGRVGDWAAFRAMRR